MRFQFCGNISCPQWFIAQISVLTKITPIKMKLIFSQIIIYYLQGVQISTKVNKLLSGTGLDIYQIHAVVSTLQFILKNSVMFQIDESVLHKQLVDLGLPKENVQAISKTYKGSKQKLFEKSFQKLPKISSNIELTYSIHEFIGSKNIGKSFTTSKKPVKFAEIGLKFQDYKQQNNQVNCILQEDSLNEMIHSLEEALAIMQDQESTKNQ